MNNTLLTEIKFSPSIWVTEGGCWTVLLTEVAEMLEMEANELVQRFGLAYSVEAAIVTFRSGDPNIVYIGMTVEEDVDVPLLFQSEFVRRMLGHNQMVRVPLIWVQTVFRLVKSGAERVVLVKEREIRPDVNTDRSILFSFKDEQDQRWVHVVAQDADKKPVQVEPEWTL